MNDAGEDLRKGGKDRIRYSMSIPLSAVIAGLLIITGAMTGLFLPRILEDKEVGEEPVETENPYLRIILSSTISSMEIDDNRMYDVPVFAALDMVYGSDEMENQVETIEDFIEEAVLFLVSNSTGYNLEIRPVGGGSPLKLNNNVTGTLITALESPVILGDDTFIASFEIYGGDLR
jgi:hypothetical protein